jgi:hypothetical protein
MTINPPPGMYHALRDIAASVMIDLEVVGTGKQVHLAKTANAIIAVVAAKFCPLLTDQLKTFVGDGTMQ